MCRLFYVSAWNIKILKWNMQYIYARLKSSLCYTILMFICTQLFQQSKQYLRGHQNFCYTCFCCPSRLGKSTKKIHNILCSIRTIIIQHSHPLLYSPRSHWVHKAKIHVSQIPLCLMFWLYIGFANENILLELAVQRRLRP